MAGRDIKASLTRRHMLVSTVSFLAMTASSGVGARVISGGVPWAPNAASPPTPVVPGGWLYLTGPEAAAIEAIVERLIPADELGPSGKDAGCAVFIDRQLAGPYGGAEMLYMRPPFVKVAPEFGIQSELPPAAQYRVGLKALDTYCRTSFSKPFAELPPAQRDEVLTALEKGSVTLDGIEARAFFNLVHQNTMEGFFADPIYGGNRDMAGWKLIGFPGARYDYRDHIDKPNQPYPLPPVGLQGRPGWTPAR